MDVLFMRLSIHEWTYTLESYTVKHAYRKVSGTGDFAWLYV